jgi:hypothetical protein
MTAPTARTRRATYRRPSIAALIRRALRATLRSLIAELIYAAIAGLIVGVGLATLMMSAGL